LRFYYGYGWSCGHWGHPLEAFCHFSHVDLSGNGKFQKTRSWIQFVSLFTFRFFEYTTLVQIVRHVPQVSFSLRSIFINFDWPDIYIARTYLKNFPCKKMQLSGFLRFHFYSLVQEW
jgi:hypothetical protein